MELFKEIKNDFGTNYQYNANISWIEISSMTIRYKVIKCKVRYEDIGRIVHDGKKIRCFKISILN